MLRRIAFLISVAVLLTVPLSADDDRPAGTRFAVAIESHDVDTIKAMLASGISTETLIDYGEHKETPLIKAAWDGEENIVRVLLDAGAKVNSRATDTGETALMNAVTQGSLPIINMLLKAGADVSIRNKFDFTPFTSAIAAGKEDIATVLLDAGARIDDTTSTLTPLMFAASAGNVEMIRFLVKHGAKVNYGVKSGGQTALLSAIYGAQPAAVQALIDLKADVNAKTKDGDTPLKAAMKGDQDDLVKILKAAGAKK